MPLYLVYGLIIASEMELSGLHTTEGIPDVQIRFGKTPERLTLFEKQGECFQVGLRQFLFTVKNVARFFVEESKTIIIESFSEARQAEIQTYLLGSVFAVLLQQRHYLVLHGSAAIISKKGVIFSGMSGAGKSTLAAALAQKSYPILTDDLCVIQAQEKIAQIIAGYPYLKLWQDAAKQLNIDTTNLKRARTSLEKYEYPIPEQIKIDRYPIQQFYVLMNHDRADVKITPVLHVEKIAMLVRNTFRLRFLAGPIARAQHLTRCGELAQQVKCFKIERPKTGFLLQELVVAIEKNVREQ